MNSAKNSPAAVAKDGGGSSSSRRRHVIVVGVLLTAGILSGLVFLSRSKDQPEPAAPPLVDLESSPPAIRQEIEEARDALLRHPHSASAWGRYGISLYAHEHVAEALVCFVEAECLNPRDHRWPYLQGLCATFTDPERGLECFERSAALKPELDVIRLRTAELALDLNDLERAEAHLRAVLDRFLDHPRANLALARLAFLRGELELAQAKAEKSRQFAPDVRMTHELLSKIAFRQNDPAAAQDHLAAMQAGGRSDDWPDPILSEVMQTRRDLNWELFNVQLQISRGQTAPANKSLARLAEEYPRSVEVRLEWGRALLVQNEAAQAIRVVEEGLKLNPDSARLHRLRGELHLRQNERQLAAESFERAIEVKPDYALAHYNLGKCLLELNDRDRGRDELREAFRLSPDLPGLKEALTKAESDEKPTTGKQGESARPSVP